MNAIKEDIIAHTPVVNTFPIIIRQLKDGSKCVFILDTLDLDNHTISMWPVDSNSTETFKVSLDAYRSSTGVSDSEEARIMEQFATMNNIQFGLVLRKRLFKVNPAHVKAHEEAINNMREPQEMRRRATDVPAPKPFDKQAFAEKLMKTFAVALAEALQD